MARKVLNVMNRVLQTIYEMAVSKSRLFCGADMWWLEERWKTAYRYEGRFCNKSWRKKGRAVNCVIELQMGRVSRSGCILGLVANFGAGLGEWASTCVSRAVLNGWEYWFEIWANSLKEELHKMSSGFTWYNPQVSNQKTICNAIKLRCNIGQRR
jgi:hypothetical protein